MREVQPFVDAYCRELWEKLRRGGIEIFYDHFSLPAKYIGDRKLEEELRSAIRRCHLFTAFISPLYVGSDWCRFERDTARYQRHQPPAHFIYWKKQVDVGSLVNALSHRIVSDVAFGSFVPSKAMDAASDASRLLRGELTPLERMSWPRT